MSNFMGLGFGTSMLYLNKHFQLFGFPHLYMSKDCATDQTNK